jgi:hypothetical protein
MAPSIPPFRLVRKPLSTEAEAMPGFEWASEEVGQRHQFGGEPQCFRGMRRRYAVSAGSG